MQIKTMKKDRSGISTMVAVAVVVIIVVIAAAAAYVLLSNDKDEDKTLAPGSYFDYDITEGDYAFHAKDTVIGQNATEYFFESLLNDDDLSWSYYHVSAKSMPEGAEKTGDEEIDTIDGVKTVEIWEYTEEYYGVTYDVKVHYDPSLDIGYIYEYNAAGYSTQTQILTEYKQVWQTSYEESADLHKAYEYSTAGDGSMISASIVCVADCLDDQYGVFYDFTSFSSDETYMLSHCPMGLPVDAVDTGETVVLTDTIDGDVTVEKWTLTFDEKDWTFYAEPDTHVIYQFTTTVDGTSYTFILDNKPE